VQIGTSGSGNHFVEFGAFSVPEDLEAEKAGGLAPLEPGHSYLALLSHSGSRGVGNKIATRFSKIAEERRGGLEGEAKKLAWLELSSEEGQEYWLSMRLAGRFAAANHAVIHERIARRIGAEAAFVTEHHHNFAFAEEWRGEEMVVHRKGATPAGAGVLGIVPGTMADTGYVTLGLGAEDSLNSAAHGAGRRMSRTRAFKELDDAAWREDLRKKGITLLGGALDEAPKAYKNPRHGDGLPGQPGRDRRGVLPEDRAHGRRLEEGPAQAEEEAREFYGPLAECQPLRADSEVAEGQSFRNPLLRVPQAPYRG